jgi:hypothetical protein
MNPPSGDDLNGFLDTLSVLSRIYAPINIQVFGKRETMPTETRFE